MAATDTPRFFKVYISHFSSESMVIPASYYYELPLVLPKTAILQGTGGCVWNVAMKKKRDEVYFGQGWTNFVEDNSLADGDFLTFVYNGDCVFEVSIYGPDGCKEARAVTEAVEDDDEDKEENSICPVTSDEADTRSESETANAIPGSENKGKPKEEAVDDSDDKEDSEHSEGTETETTDESEMANTNRRSKNKGNKKVDSSAEDTDSDYVQDFGHLDIEESSNSDSSADYQGTTTRVKPKAKNPKNKGKSKLSEDVDALEPVKKKREKVKAMIKNPEAHLDDPKNIFFETGVKNRKYELLVHAQLVKDYFLKFPDYIYYIDPKGTLEARTARWGDQRVCIKKWNLICNRNKLQKKDRVVCEIFRNQNLVYAVKIHIIKGKYL